MGVITTGSISALLSPQYRKAYFEAGEERPLEYPLIANVMDMEYNPFTDLQIAGLATMPAKPEGTRFTLDALKTGGTKTVTAVPYGMACEITFEAWRDELYGAINEMVTGMARAARHRQETQFWALFDNAFTSGTGFDGTYLCSTSHTRSGDGGTSANRPSVDIAFSATGLQAACASFEGTLNERGLPQLLGPSTVVVHYSRKYTAREILGSGGKPFTSDNEINALIADDLNWFVGHHLTSQTAWFMLARKGVHDLNFLWRDNEIFDMFDDPGTKSSVATAYQRFVSYFSSWRGVWGTTG